MKKILLPALLLISSVALGQRGQVRDKIEEDNYKKHGEPGLEKYNEWMQGKVLNAKIAEQYLFPLSMTMEMTGYKNGKKREPVRTKYYINSTTANFATKIEDEKKKEQMLMVYDMKANSMLMLDQVKMTGMAININAFMSGEAIANREKNMQNGTGKSDHDCKKTGKTKTILGYHCEEYICTDEKKNTRSEIWLSPKVAINMAASMRGPMAGYAGGWSHMAGMMMEANFYKNDQLESSLLVTELNESANMKVVTADYKLNGL
jgi:hypothetical protein